MGPWINHARRRQYGAPCRPLLATDGPYRSSVNLLSRSIESLPFSVMSILLNGKDGFRPLAGSDVRWLVDQHPHVGRTWRALLSMVRKRSGLARIRDVVP